MPMLIYPEACHNCGEPHPHPDYKAFWDNLGDYDCPKCKAKEVFHVEWETEVDLDPIEDED